MFQAAPGGVGGVGGKNRSLGMGVKVYEHEGSHQASTRFFETL